MIDHVRISRLFFLDLQLPPLLLPSPPSKPSSSSLPYLSFKLYGIRIDEGQNQVVDDITLSAF